MPLELFDKLLLSLECIGSVATGQRVIVDGPVRLELGGYYV